MKNTDKTKKPLLDKTTKTKESSLWNLNLSMLGVILTPVYISPRNMGEFKVYEDSNQRMPVLLNWPTPNVVIGPAIVNVKTKDK